MIEIDNVTKVYKAWRKKKQVTAIDDIALQVSRGEILGLLGPNGAGKTTMVKMICGLLRPTEGRIRLDGLDVIRNRKQMLEKVGVVLEGSRTSHWPLTVRENLNYYGNLRGVRGKTLKDRGEMLVDFIGLRDKMDTVVRKVSRGMKQKLAICIALMSDPEVILFDEPTTGLDVASSRTIKAKIRELTEEQGKTAIITTHDMNVAQEICNRIAIIHNGKLVALDTTENLISLFSDQIYEFHFGNTPRLEGIQGMGGVQQIESWSENGHMVMRLALDQASVLYDVMAFLKQEGAELSSLSRKETSLEEIFFKLTSSEKEEEEK